MKKFRKKPIAAVGALVVFVGLVAFMLWLNDWGRSSPDDLQQLLWAFSCVIWPALTYRAVAALEGKP